MRVVAEWKLETAKNRSLISITEEWMRIFAPQQTDQTTRKTQRPAKRRTQADPPATTDQIQTTVENEVVILEGRVRSWHEKQLASSKARSQYPTAIIDNRITVLSQR
jgi:osmotically-inducible protein OsmY